MSRVFNTVSLFFVFMLTAACSKGDNPLTRDDESDHVDVNCQDFENCFNSPPLSVHPALNLSAFPTMGSRISQLKDDLDKIANPSLAYPLNIPNNPDNLSKFFGAVFGGRNPEDVKNYLNQRIRYLIPHDVSAFSISYSDRVSARNGATNTSSILAKNAGLLLWLTSVGFRENVYTFIGNAKVTVDSSRVGIVQLGESFWSYGDLEDQNNIVKVSAARLATLIHEGRHSDCTGGFSPSLVDSFSAALGVAGSDPFSTLVGSTRCGHLHVNCPNTHPSEELRGKAACDSDPWGAYAIETVFSQAVATECSQCSAEEKQIALLSALDSRARLIPLSNDPNLDHFERMLSGVLGNPDMSSAGVQ